MYLPPSFPDLRELAVRFIGDDDPPDTADAGNIVYVARSAQLIEDIVHAATSASYRSLEVTLYGDDSNSGALLQYTIIRRSCDTNNDIEFINEGLLIGDLERLSAHDTTRLYTYERDSHVDIPNAPLRALFDLALVEWQRHHETCAAVILKTFESSVPRNTLRLIAARLRARRRLGTNRMISTV